MNKKNKYQIILTTFPNAKVAEKIATQLVKKKYVACATIVPQVKSIYCWKKKLCKDKEVLCLLKTQLSLFKQVESFIILHHPYTTPEILALNINNGNSLYLQWIQESTKL